MILNNGQNTFETNNPIQIKAFKNSGYKEILNENLKKEEKTK